VKEPVRSLPSRQRTQSKHNAEKDEAVPGHVEPQSPEMNRVAVLGNGNDDASNLFLFLRFICALALFAGRSPPLHLNPWEPPEEATKKTPSTESTAGLDGIEGAIV
jgi:hypothetical protein